MLLLNRKGPTSFADLRTVDGEECATFTDAAQKLGLMESDAMFVGAMQDACTQLSSRAKLCRYFALLVCHGCPAHPEKLLDDFLDQLYPAPIVNVGSNAEQPFLSKELRREKVLRIVEYYLRCQGSSCRFFTNKLPIFWIPFFNIFSLLGIHGLPTDYNHDAQARIMEDESLQDDFYGDQPRTKSPQQLALEGLEKLNEDQTNAFEEIKNAFLNKSAPRLFFVEGAGGCGLFLYTAFFEKFFFFEKIFGFCFFRKKYFVNILIFKTICLNLKYSKIKSRDHLDL